MNNLTDITHTHTNMFSFEKLRCFQTEPRKATFRPKAKRKNAFLASPLKLRVSLPDMFYVYYIYKHIYTLFRYIRT